jgi:hypothetical protein
VPIRSDQVYVVPLRLNSLVAARQTALEPTAASTRRPAMYRIATRQLVLPNWRRSRRNTGNRTATARQQSSNAEVLGVSGETTKHSLREQAIAEPSAAKVKSPRTKQITLQRVRFLNQHP